MNSISDLAEYLNEISWVNFTQRLFQGGYLDGLNTNKPREKFLIVYILFRKFKEVALSRSTPDFFKFIQASTQGKKPADFLESGAYVALIIALS
jgi:hypothetical protein